MGEPVTLEICEKYHKDFCEKLALHDQRAARMEANMDLISKAQVNQAASLEAATVSQQKTQEHLEQASEALEMAAKTLAASNQSNQEWQSWAQRTITALQAHVSKSNAKLIGAICGVVVILAGLKWGGYI